MSDLEELYLWNYLSATWSDALLSCKDFRNWNNLKSNTLNESFRVTTLFINTNKWYDCGYIAELPQLISHYLDLDLLFIKPNNDFDGTIGLINETHSYGPLKMIQNNQVDFVAENVFMTEKLFHPDLAVFSNQLEHNFGINFVLKKKTIRLSVRNYFNVFSLLIWALFFKSILVVAAVQGLKLIKENQLKINRFKFIFDLIFGYFNLMIAGQSSNLLARFKPRHYLMYFIPLLCIIVNNLMTSSIYSNMISPPKQWCQSIDCFAQSNYHFNVAEEYTWNLLLKHNKSEKFNKILKRSTFHRGLGKLIN